MSSARNSVTVACKLPHGLIMRLHDMVDYDEPQQGGGTKTVKRAQPRPESYTLKGYAPKYDPALPPAAQGSSFALTHGIPAEFWEAWLKQNRDLACVVNGLVFASTKADTVDGMSREADALQCGLEPLNPAKLPRGLKPFTTKDAEAA